MAQTAQVFQGGTDEAAWLSHLVGAFDQISRSHAPCAAIGPDEIDPADVAALLAQLRRTSHPASYAMAG